MGEFRLIIDEDDFPRELSGVADCERAVREGSLTPETQVTVYRAGMNPVASTAGSLPELNSLFKPVEPPSVRTEESNNPASKPLPPAPLQLTIPDRKKPARSRPAEKPAVERINPPPETSFQSTQRIPVKEEEEIDDRSKRQYRAPGAPASDGKVLWIIVVAVLALFLAFKSCGSNQSASTQNVDENLSTTDMNATDMNAVDLNATEGSLDAAVVRYLATDTNVRSAPRGRAKVLAMLTRGTQIEGSLVAGEGAAGPWIKLSTGPYAGGFVLAMQNVRETPPPSLDASAAGVWRAVARAPVYAEPDSNSAVLQYTNPDANVRVYGRTEGGFLEVWVRTGLIGYVSEDALTTEPATPATDASGPYDQGDNGSSTVAAVTQPVLRNPGFITADDYPASSVANNEQGRVIVQIGVDPNGRVTACSVLMSSGYAALDTASCRLAWARASFFPARAADGSAISGTYIKNITWTLN